MNQRNQLLFVAEVQTRCNVPRQFRSPYFGTTLLVCDEPLHDEPWTWIGNLRVWMVPMQRKVCSAFSVKAANYGKKVRNESWIMYIYIYRMMNEYLITCILHTYKSFQLVFQVILSFDDYFFHILTSLSSHLVTSPSTTKPGNCEQQ